tara:strand:- start:54 stop:203 length:150 start_codon:yes stop_codon:yes gene_type:complete
MVLLLRVDNIPVYPRSPELATNLFYFYANKLLDKTQKILYTWTVAGDGG